MSQTDIEVILVRLEVLEKKLDEAVADVKELRKTPSCPQPGLCLLVQKDVADLRLAAGDREHRLRELESLRDQAKGVGAAGRAIWAFIGAGGLGVLFGLWHLAHK